ncbi:hypothetical protein E2986_10115 [Frieseomelitta varia]|uniref:Inorganic phosphate cotransporter n=1 Tax=Frieseomelitta varia TaxID=561572 RepID=A0A833SP29_9HYME|nr:hypothetical protein E2986_10115 [Frieseomelitta varia]
MDIRNIMFPIRYLMAIMGSIGLAIIYGFKVNVSVAIVAMVNHTAVKLSTLHQLETENKTAISLNECHYDSALSNTTKTVTEDGPFVWNEPLQGLILSSYFWGYMVSLIPGGRMADLLSAKWVMNGSVLLNLVASILSPVAANMHYSLFILMRVIQGIGGVRTALGTVISILLTGILAANLQWVWIFYIEGILCLFWCIAWWIMIEDNPEKQTRFISQEEKDYIMQSLGQSENNGEHNEKPTVPWGKVLRSKPFMAILIAHFCSNFGWYMLLIELPTFMNQILKFDMSSNAGLSSMPFLCMWIFTMVLTSVVPMFCLIGVSYVGCSRTLAVTLMTIGVTCIGGMYSGFLSNHIDIAPNFAGTLVAITNCVATIPGFVVPIFVGKLTHGNQTIGAWRIIFFATVTLYIIEILVYTIFGSGEEQPWNKTKPNDDEASDQTLPLKENSTK